MYFLPPIIFTYETINTMEIKYINYSNAPIVSPLQKVFKHSII